MKKLLSLSHTDSSKDSRILKYKEIGQRIDVEYLCLGIRRGSSGASSGILLVESRFLKIVEKLILRLPEIRLVRISLRSTVYIELLIKLTYQAIKFRPNLVHVHDWFTLPIAVLIKKTLRTKIIYDAHELESETNGISREMSRLSLIVEKLSWRHIDHFITVSESIESWYQANLGSKTSTLILNSPLEISDRSNSSAQSENYLRETFGIATKSPIFIYVGALELGRGIPLILDAAKESKQECAVVFLGRGSLESLIKESSVYNKRVFHHYSVPHTEITSIAASADFGLCLIENVSLSDWYCLPNKLFEYAFSRIPVIASNFPDMTKVIHKHGLGRCVEPSKESLSELFDEIKSATQWNAIARFENLEELSWAAQAEKAKTIYLEML